MKHALTLILVAVLAVRAQAQIPPISTACVLQDTVRADSVAITITVQSTEGWDQGGGVGLYWAADPVAGWQYITGSPYSLDRSWLPPAADMTYHLATSVIDNAGNDEGHDFTPEATFYYCPTCPEPTEPPGPSEQILPHLQALARLGIFEFGQATVANWRYCWTPSPTHDAAGQPLMPADHYLVEVESWPAAGGDTLRFSEVAPDTFITVTYSYGWTQRVHVAGVGINAQNEEIQGPWSLWSEEVTDYLDPPGAPGVPLRTLILE